MRKQKTFTPSLSALEYRLAPAIVAPMAAPADVSQDGNYDGQFGDQTSVDVTTGADSLPEIGD
ncbi:MAG: hypothetical protein NVSMB9_16320 [Isosphaeraceae bacterium]